MPDHRHLLAKLEVLQFLSEQGWALRHVSTKAHADSHLESPQLGDAIPISTLTNYLTDDEFVAEFDEAERPRNDPVELLVGPVHVRGTHRYNGEAVLSSVGFEQQVSRRL